MTFAPPAAPTDVPAPLFLPDDLQLTHEQFAALCQANPSAVLELDGESGPLAGPDSRTAPSFAPSAPNWWWNWPAPTTKAPAALPLCAENENLPSQRRPAGLAADP